MLRLVNQSDFVGLLNISFKQSDSAFDTYQEQIERNVLTELLGDDMYDAMLVGLTPPTQYLVDTYLTGLMKYYFYYYFSLDRESHNTTLGEFAAQAENALRTPPMRNKKLFDAWNSGTKLYNYCREYIDDHIEDYLLYDPEFDRPKQKQNVWGINTTGTKSNWHSCTHDDYFIKGCR